MLARCFRSVPRARSISRGALERSSARLHLTSRSPASALSTTAFDSSIVHKSPHQDIVLPNKTIWNIVEDQARINGDKTAFICGIGHDVVTFHELYERAKRVAAGLANDGVGKGDAVVLHSFNCMEYPTVLLALASLGAICSPAPPTAQPVELASQIRESKASHIITHVELAQIALEAAKQADIATNFVYTMGDPSKSSESLTSIRDLTDRETGSFEFEDIDPELTALLPFSSGTTGVPKGVALSARNLLANALQIRQIEDLGSHSLGLLPYFHIYGMTLMNLSLCHGAANVVLPRFEPASFLQALAKYKIRAAHIAPPVALFLAHHPMVDNYDLSATEFMVSGGAPMGKEVENLVEKRLQIPVKQAYGLTEASPAVNYTEDGFRKPGSVGRLVPNTELRVRCTATDVDLPIGEHGELLYRGPQVMIGYSNNQEANKSVFTDDGFLRTGDIGYIDEDGFVFIVDRVKELIKYKGHQVAPAELEDVLNKHPQIRDSCCVRGQDSFGEEIPKAFVVLKDAENSAGITETDIMEYVAENVAPFKKVRQLEFIDEIPKSATGKILRRQLQASENQQQRT